MATMVGKNPDFNEVVKDLIELEYDAIAAYKSTIERLENKAYAAKIAEFMQDHERHLSELTSYLTSNGIEAPTSGNMKQILTQGKVVLADLFGDTAILKAMKTNEDDTVTAYERASKHENISSNMRSSLTQAHQDELRHRSWILQTLEAEDRQAA